MKPISGFVDWTAFATYRVIHVGGHRNSQDHQLRQFIVFRYPQSPRVPIRASSGAVHDDGETTVGMLPRPGDRFAQQPQQDAAQFGRGEFQIREVCRADRYSMRRKHSANRDAHDPQNTICVVSHETAGVSNRSKEPRVVVPMRDAKRSPGTQRVAKRRLEPFELNGKRRIRLPAEYVDLHSCTPTCRAR